MTTAEKYNAALKLAQSGRYQEALTMIEGIDHAKVNALRDKIITRLPAPDDVPAKKRTPRYRRYTLTLLIVLSVGVLVFIASVFRDTNARYHESALHMALYRVCLDIYDTGSTAWENCGEAVDSSIVLYRAEVELCFDQSKEADLEQEFIRCLADQGVKI